MKNCKKIPQLKSTDTIQTFITYMENEDYICQEATDYFKLYNLSMEDTAKQMIQDDNQPEIIPWFVFGLVELFEILPTKVRLQYAKRIQKDDGFDVALMRIYREHKDLMTQAEVSLFKKHLKGKLPKIEQPQEFN